MTARGLLHLYRIRLRARAGAELLALAGIAVGVALFFAALIANASLTGSVRDLTEGIVGEADLQLSARSSEGFDARVLGRVMEVPGATAAPVVEAKANLAGPAGRRSVLLVGGDPRSKGAGGPLLRSARAGMRRGPPGLLLPAPLAADLGVRAGGEVDVETGLGAAPAPVVAELRRDAIGSLAEVPVALAPLPLVQELAGMQGRISRIFVTAAPGRQEEVERSLRRIAGDRLNLAPAEEEAVVFERAAYPASRSTSLFSVLSAVVGFLFALTAVLLTVPQRRRLIADLRMAGFAPGTVVRIFLFDALVLGAVGSTLGLLLGAESSRLLFDDAPGYLASAFAIGSQRIIGWQSAAPAVLAGMLAACLSVLLPLRTFLSADWAAESSMRSVGRPGLLAAAGGIVLVLSLTISMLAPTASLGGVVVLLLALLLLLGPWLRLAAGAAGAVCRWQRSPVAIMAALELRAGSDRVHTLALAATGAVAVFAAVAIGGARADLQRGLDAIAADVDRGADVWVAFRGPSNIFGTTPIAIAPERLRAIERLQGVRDVERNRGGFLDVERNRVWVLAPAPSRVRAILRNQVEEGDPAGAVRRLRRGDGVALSEGLARELGVGVGDRVALPFPAPTRLRVAALTNNFGWPGGAIAVSSATYARAWGSPSFSSLGIRLEAGSPPDRAVSAVRSILGRRSGLRVETARERIGRQRATSRAGLARLKQIAAMILISSALALAAALAAVVWQRRPIFAALKVHGLGEGELWRMLLLEAAVLLGAGCSLGAALGLVGQVLLDRALEVATGFPVIYVLAAPTALRVLVLSASAAIAILAVPGWLAVRVPPQPGLSDR